MHINQIHLYETVNT